MKTQIINIDSSKSDCICFKDDITVININALIKRYNLDKNYINNQIKMILPTISKVNFTNLASLCYKLGMDYASEECFNLVKRLVNDFRAFNSAMLFVQNNIYNQGETDMLPFENLFEIDNNSGTIYLNKILKDKLRTLGYADSQFNNLLINFKQLEKLLPCDMLEDVAFCNNKNVIAYTKIKELLY